MSPDIAEASAFIERLAGSVDAPMTFQTFYDRKDRKRAELARVHHGTLDEYAEHLIALQQEGAGVFVMVNEGDGKVYDGNKSCRTAKNVSRVRALFVDLDGSPLGPVTDCHVLPDLVVVSSPSRYHAYWLNVKCPLSDFSTAQKSLAARFDGDSTVHDLPRVMRLPGFWHQKGEPFMTRIHR
ncbi:MAG: DNA-primase RepB domain-containing protein [Haliea sp.]|uniref:DNA-primase RepB domain-containing protein n=1 Tax=Haliea sp. TaxID=1932666 RepID=UPI0032EE926C